MAFELKAYVTNDGLAVLNQLAVGGQPLVITHAEVGSGKIPYTNEEERALAAAERSSLVEKKLNASIVDQSFVEGILQTSIRITNSGLSESIDIWEAGIFCADLKGSGANILICYLQFGDEKDEILSSAVPIYFRQYDVAIEIGNVQYEIEVAPAAIATKRELDAHTKNTTTAHLNRATGPIATLNCRGNTQLFLDPLEVVATLTGTGEISPDNRYELNGVMGASLFHYSPNAANPAEMIDSGLNGTTGNEDTVKTRLRTGFLPSVFDGKTGATSGVPTGMISKGTYCYDANKTFLGTGAANAVKGGYVRFVYANSDDTTIIAPETLAAFRASFQYEPGATTAGAYQPFVAFNAYPIPFGREVIGFAHAPAEIRLDGKPSKSTGRKVTFNGTEAWSLSGVTGVDGVRIFIRPISGAKNYGASVIGAGILCDAYKAVQPSSIGSLAVNQCFIRTTSDDARTDAYFAAPYNTVDEFKAALAAAPITVFYELETPDEFTLDPATFPSIVSLAGVNHVYSDLGTALTVTEESYTAQYISPESIGAVALAFGALRIYVSKSGSDMKGDGSSAAPFLTIQKAINHAYGYIIPNGTKYIYIGDGTYKENLQLRGPENITLLSSSGDATKVIIESDTENEVVNANCWLVLLNLTLRAQSVAATVIRAVGASITVDNCIIRGSGIANAKEGLFLDTCIAKIVNCTITGHQYGVRCRNGGDILVGTSTISNCTNGIIADNCTIHQYSNTNTATTPRAAYSCGLLVNAAQSLG